MAKISQASSKYVVHATIEIDGVVDRPDVVGAIFGQIEGLLGADLELRELQRSGRIGRIEVNVKSKDGKTTGTITIPSSLDKAETAIIGGALEIIERIGPCTAKIVVTQIEDERIAKRQAVINRAKELLKNMNDSVLPDSQEITGQVSTGVRVKEIQQYGSDKLAAGPDIDSADEIILVEGRADVVNLLKHGFKNVISVNGTKAPKTIVEVTKGKTAILFCDGDRGGDMIINALTSTASIDFITKAPDGKEVEELQKKEIHQALRNKLSTDDWMKKNNRSSRNKKSRNNKKDSRSTKGRGKKPDNKKSSEPRKPRLSNEEKEQFADLYKKVKGKKRAHLLDNKKSLLGTIPVEDVAETLSHMTEAHIVIMDGEPDNNIQKAADKARLRAIIATKGSPKMRTGFATVEDLE